jgi:hypothetical protein
MPEKSWLRIVNSGSDNRKSAIENPAKVPRIAYLSANFASAIADRTEAFRQGLRELGYVDLKAAKAIGLTIPRTYWPEQIELSDDFAI